uniref:B3 domain-containing protein At2g24670-like n=1 Tax=Fragaria vesca subsp. vesca TaxID=101020 RepID=UPI0005C8F00F|nr:PREDICTED: B3 domain-containing protein At2g24670-like [Fragaria vesca subsp. vesca]
MATLAISSSSLSYLQEQEEEKKMGSCSSSKEIVCFHEDWSALHMLVEVSCQLSEQEKKGMCLSSLLRHQHVCPKKPRSPPRPIRNVIASGSSYQNNRSDESKGLKRKRKQSVECLDDHVEDSAKKKKKRRYMTRMDHKGVYQPPPDLPEEYKKMVNGAKAELVIQKQLFTSDVKRNLNRLSLPPKQILCEFLRRDEIEGLKENDTFMKVPFIDPELEMEEISVSFWKLSSSDEKSLVLNSNWNYIVEKNKLVKGDLIQVWSFRDSNDRLQLALVVLKRAEESENGVVERAEECANGEEGRSTARSSSVSSVSEDSAVAGHKGSTCLKIRFKCNASKSESTSTSDLLSQ